MDEDVAEIKQRLFNGGMNAKTNPDTGIESWEDITLIYAGQKMQNGHKPSEYHVPPVSAC